MTNKGIIPMYDIEVDLAVAGANGAGGVMSAVSEALLEAGAPRSEIALWRYQAFNAGSFDELLHIAMTWVQAEVEEDQ